MQHTNRNLPVLVGAAGAAGHTLPICQGREVKCSDGSCIPRQSVCDGNKDCDDGSDEYQCSEYRVDNMIFILHGDKHSLVFARCVGSRTSENKIVYQ